MDNIVHLGDKSIHADEILFEKPVKVYQIRIVRCSIPLHTNLRSHRSNTQSDPIHKFEVFFKDLKTAQSRFQLAFNTKLLNDNPLIQDSIIATENGV